MDTNLSTKKNRTRKKTKKKEQDQPLIPKLPAAYAFIKVFEVSSVSILSTMKLVKKQPVSVIHGLMMLIDDRNYPMNIFSRSQCEALKGRLSVQDKSSVILPKCKLDRLCFLPKSFRFKFLLTDESRQTYVAENRFSLDFIDSVKYDTQQELHFMKGDMLVNLRFTVFEQPVIALVEFRVFKNDGRKIRNITKHLRLHGIGSDDRCKVSVRGSVYAKSKLRDGNDVSRLLYDNHSKSSKWVVDFPFDMAAVAVPVYSSLLIQADLEIDGEKFVAGEFGDAWVFQPNLFAEKPHKKTLVGQNWHVQVRVSWMHADTLEPQNEFLESDIGGVDSLLRENMLKFRHALEIKGEENAMESSGPFPHIKTSPLFEVSSVTIARFDGKQPLSFLHGVIMLIDDEDRAINFFSRSQREALKEPYSQDGLALMLPKCRHDSPYWLPKSFMLKFLLTDELNLVHMSGEGPLLDFNDNVDYDKEQELQLITGDILITLRYTVFQWAVVACVEFTLFKKNDQGCKTKDIRLDGVGSDQHCKVPVIGTVYAKSKLRDGNDVSRLLFDNHYNGSKWVVDVPFDLAAVAVPFYSSLLIQADLIVEDEHFVADAWTFQPDEFSLLPFTKTLFGKTWCLQVGVSWRHALDFARPNESFDLVNRAVKNEDCLWRKDILYKLPEDEQRRILSLPLPSSYNQDMVEVYSVSVHSSSDDVSDVFSLYGSIVCYDNHIQKGYTIFKRDKNEPYVIHPNETLPLVHPRTFYEGPCFQMYIDLKDAKGREISNGSVEGWDTVTASGWYDSRLCSVVRGKDGFAAAHYSILSLSTPLTIKVFLRSRSSTGGQTPQTVRVYGSIRAKYSSYRYCNDYEKRYYKSIVFEKSESEFVELSVVQSKKSARCRNSEKQPINVSELFREESESDELSDGESEFEIPLSKSAIAVPKGAFLVLEVDLRLQAVGEIPETLEGEVMFNSIKAAALQAIEGLNSSVLLSVKW